MTMDAKISPRVKLDWSNLLGFDQLRSRDERGLARPPEVVDFTRIGPKVGAIKPPPKVGAIEPPGPSRRRRARS